MGGQALSEKSVGTARLAQGLCWNPVSFCGSITSTTVEMANPGLADTRLAVPTGRAMVGVAEIGQRIMRISAQSARTRLLKPGLDDFDADRGQIRVFDGKVVVRAASTRVEERPRTQSGSSRASETAEIR